MSKITAHGRAWLDPITCTYCNTDVKTVLNTNTACRHCGAFYKYISGAIKGEEIIVTYEQDGFKCLMAQTLSKCENNCPSPYMFCKDHSSEDTIKKQEVNIISAKTKVETEEEKLRLIKESRKTWLVMDLSGINEDNTLSED